MDGDFYIPHNLAFFLDQTLTSVSYLDLLQNQIEPAWKAVAGENQEVWFQMDGCPAHNSIIVRHHLLDAFQGNGIGPNHMRSWQARSPNLSLNNFFPWGHIIDKIYKNDRHEILEELKNPISAVSDRISPYQLANVRREFYNRLGYCLEANAGLFEHLLKH